MIPVVLCGGSGTRLWPLSRERFPKQFLRLLSDSTLLQETLLRLRSIDVTEDPVVVCNQEHRFIVAEQLREIGVRARTIVLEPVAKNTAPAVAAAAFLCDAGEQLLVLPADHLIPNLPAFQGALHAASSVAGDGWLTTFGVTPTAPETGYGYIRRGQEIDTHAREVAEFVEKPDQQTAERYLESGNYYWNSGMFLFRAGDYLSELERLDAKMFENSRAACKKAARSFEFTVLDPDSFGECPADSIDYAVMERTAKAALVPLDAGWSDIGSWSALWEVMEKDEAGNASRGDVLLQDTGRSYLHSESKLVAGIGLDDMVVVETDDAILVAPKSRVQDVKRLVHSLRKAGRSESDLHRKVYRPWGTYDTVDVGERHLAKRIVVKPGAKLSLQLHHHRAEHWVVVRGTATVTRGDDVFTLREDESTYIPVGTKHSLENAGESPLEIIEVQSGTYLDEDDIVRFEDVYGRADETQNGN